MENSQLKIPTHKNSNTQLTEWLLMIKENKFEVRKVNSSTAVQSKLPILKEVGEFEQPLKAMYFKLISDYILIYHPGSDNELVSTEFIELLFENYYTLNPIDIFAFINYIKLNKPDTSGHKITPSELIQSLQDYIEVRCEAKETELHNQKLIVNEPVHPKVADALQKLIDKQEEKEKMKVQNINSKIDAKTELEIKKTTYLVYLESEVENKRMTEQDAMTNWKTFTDNLKN